MWSNDPLNVTWESDNCMIKIKIKIFQKTKNSATKKANRWKN